MRSTFGKIFEGFLVSSAMFTESSKPTMAKKASVVAAMTDQNMPLSPAGSKVKARETSPWPEPIAHMPMRMMIRRPVSSTQVSTTLAFTLSPTPRKLTMATSAMKRSPVRVMPRLPSPRPKLVERLAAKARRRGRGGGDARTHHREGHEEGDEMDAEGLVGVQGGARGPGVLGDELEVAEGRHHRDHEGHQERQPDHAADLLRHLAGQRIDAGAQNVADDEEQQQSRTHHPTKADQLPPVPLAPPLAAARSLIGTLASCFVVVAAANNRGAWAERQPLGVPEASVPLSPRRASGTIRNLTKNETY